MYFLNTLKTGHLEKENKLTQLKLLMEEFCRNINNQGYNLKPYQGNDIEQIKKLSQEDQEKSFKFFSNYFQIYEASGQEKLDMSQDKEILWIAIRKLGLRPTSDLLTHVEERDVVEIYTAEGIQIFRNLRFFEICSYSLDDLFGASWMELYKRDSQDLQELGALASTLFSGTVRTTVPAKLRQHTLQELRSPELFRIRAQHKYLSPLFSQEMKNLVGASVIISEAEVVGKMLNTDIPQTKQPGIYSDIEINS